MVYLPVKREQKIKPSEGQCFFGDIVYKIKCDKN